MALNLISSPIVTESGIIKNLFAGFLPVNYIFKREDLQITSIGAGVDQYSRIVIGTDLTSELSVGDSIYLSAESVSGYTYESTGIITAITTTTIDVDIAFIESSTSGYINYKKNWYLEAQLINKDNSLIKILPFSIKNNGDLEGNVILDVSFGNQKNTQAFDFSSQFMDEPSISFKIQYKEVYEGSSESFTEINETICLVFATIQPDQESFLNSLDNAEFYQGYPFGAILAHTEDNNDEVGLLISYDELDINLNNVTTDNNIGTQTAEVDGFLFANLDKDITYDSTTEFVKFKAEYTATLPFFDGTFFDGAFFETT